MKKIIFIVLILMFLVGCNQNEAAKEEYNEKKEVSSSEVHKEQGINGLLFDAIVADPQDMTPVFEIGTCSVKAELFMDEYKNYKGNILITREKPQTGYKEGFMKLEYEGILQGGNDIDIETKETLNKMAGGSIKEGSVYGIINANARMVDRRFVEFPDFLDPMDYVNSFASDEEIPFLLSVDGENAELYLYFHELAKLKVDGETKIISTDEVKKGSNTFKDALYINDKAISSEKGALKQIYRLLFIGKKKEDTKYAGRLLYSMVEEKTITDGVFTKGEKSKLIEKDIELLFEPFDEIKYRNSGGTEFEGKTDKFSHMSFLNCEGQNFIFMKNGDHVVIELQNTSFKGLICGEFSAVSDEISEIAEESYDMYHAENEYYSTGDNSENQSSEIIDNAMAGINQSGIKLTEEQLKMMEAAIMNMGEMPNGQSKWLPEGFIPMQAPMDGDFMEQPPSTVFGGNFQYQEDTLWIEDILPIYINKFSKMRDFKEKGGVVDGHRYHEMVFRFGEGLVFIEFSDNAAGALVSVIIY